MRIIEGKPYSLKTSTIFEEISRNQSRSIIIVPELFSHKYERLLAKKTGNKGSAKAEVLTFKRIINRVFSEVGGLCETSLNDAGRLAYIQDAILKVGSSLCLYKNILEKPDVILEILSAIDEFKCYNISPEQILEASDMAEGRLAKKLYDLGQIYFTYNALSNKSDPRDEMDKLCNITKDSNFFKNTAIYFDGFSGFTAQEISFIIEILKKNQNTTFVFDIDVGDKEMFYGTQKTINMLKNIAKNNGVKYGCITQNEVKITKPEVLSFVADNVLRSKNNTIDIKDDSVKIISAKGVFEECEAVAGVIKNAVRQGSEYRDFAVVSREFETYQSSIEIIFDKYDIPIFISEKTDIMSKPIFVLVSSAVLAITDGYKYDDIFSCLKTGLTHISRDECDRVENYVLRWNIVGKAWEKEWKSNPVGFAGVITNNEKEKLEKINCIREKIIAPFKKLKNAFDHSKNGRDYASALYDFLIDIECDKKIEEIMFICEEKNRKQTADEYRQLWDILISAIEQFCFIKGEDDMDKKEFISVFSLMLSAYDIGSIPVSLDCVACGSIDRVCETGIKNLIVLGINDGVLPKASSLGGVLTDSDKEDLIGLGIELSATASEKVVMEQEMIYKAFSCPTDSLVLSYHTYSDDGGETRPSFLIASVLKLVSGLEVTEYSGNSVLFAEKPCIEAAGVYLGGEKNGITKAAFNYYKDDFKIFEIERKKQCERGPIKYQSMIKALYGEDIQLTASRVDKFYSCHFAFFAQYGLRAKTREKASFNALEVGNFIHFVLENTIKELKSFDGGIKQTDETQVLEISQKYIKEYIEQYLGGVENKTSRFNHLFNRINNMLSDILTNVLAEMKKSDFSPLDFELDFSDGGDLPPVSLEIDNHTNVKISGKVDRVDGYIKNNKLYLKVIDYKSGVKDFAFTELYRGLNLQLLIYLFALEETALVRYRNKLQTDIVSIVPSGALYVPVRQTVVSAPADASVGDIELLKNKELRRSGIVLDNLEIIEAMENDFENSGRFLPVSIKKNGEFSSSSSIANLERLGQLSKHIEKKLKEMGELLLKGNVEANPYYKNKNSSYCDWCDFKPICQFDDKNNNDKKQYLINLNKNEFWNRIEEGDTDGD